jgi:hypothetical protein
MGAIIENIDRNMGKSTRERAPDPLSNRITGENLSSIEKVALSSAERSEALPQWRLQSRTSEPVDEPHSASVHRNYITALWAGATSKVHPN